MAGLDWIQVDSGFSSSLAVLCATDLLDMDPRTFTGAMVDLQDWAVRNLPSGRFGALPMSVDTSSGRAPDVSTDERLWRKMLERVVRWDGAPGAFWDAMVHAGLLVWEQDSVRLTLCDRYVQVLEKKAKDAERKRRERAGKTSVASTGRPADTSGTSPARKRKENEKKTSSAAAPEDLGSEAPRRMMPVPADADTTPVEELPVQRSLPGMHLVPASLPSDERRKAAASRTTPADTSPPSATTEPARATSRAAAFFVAFQDERCRTFPGVPREEPPSGWSDWYRQALTQVDDDEGRLLEACRAYLASDWGRSRQPAGTARAFCSPKVWVRYVSPLTSRASPSTPDSALASVDTSTDAGRRWQECLAWLQEDGHRYAVTWLVQARAVALEHGKLVLQAPNAYVGQWLREHYGPLVDGAAQRFSLLGIQWQLPADSGQTEVGT